MGGQESLLPSSDRLLWNKIYGAMKEILLSQQSQIETLIADRDFLESYVGVQHEQWSAKERFLQSHIEQMKKEQSKTCLMEAAKLDVMVGAKECEAHLYKQQLEFAESELEDIRTCIKSLSTDMENLKEKADFAAADNVKQIGDASGSSSIFDGESCMHVKREIKKLKHAYKKLSARRDAEVAALLAEKDFAWNQFKKMESEYLCLVKCKHTEVDEAKLAAEKLQGNVEKLLLSLNEKEEIIMKLEAERAMLLSDVRKHAEEVEKANNNMSRLRLEMDELHLIALEKDKIVAHLREELCKLKIDLEKSSLESSSSLKKIKSEGLTNTMPKIHLQKCSSIGMLGSSGKIPSQNHRTSSMVTFKAPTSEDVHKCSKKNDRNSNSSTIQQHRTSTRIAFKAQASTDVPIITSEELSETKGLTKDGLEKICSSSQTKSKGKAKNGSTAGQQIILQNYSGKDERNSYSNTAQQRRTSSSIAFTAHASADVPVLRGEKGSSLSSLGKRLLFNSDFKIPKLRNSRLRTL